MAENAPNTEDQNISAPLVRGKYYIPPDISDEDLEARYAEHHENNPLETTIVVNKERTATIITSYSLGEDGNWEARDVVLDHTRPKKEVKINDPEGYPLEDFEELLDEEANAARLHAAEPDSPKVKMNKIHKKRLSSLNREKESMLRKCEVSIAEQTGLASPTLQANPTASNSNTRRQNILAELKAFARGLQSIRWEKKKAALEESIAFAATPEGMAIEELKNKAREEEIEKQRKERVKKNKTQGKLGKYNVFSGYESEGNQNWKGKRKFGGNDPHRVTKWGGEARRGGGRERGGRGGRDGRGARGGRGGRGGQGRGAYRGTYEGISERPVAMNP